jgi:tRNA threonylcarbamoyladenosine biosynthesis protein TsaE
MTLEPIEIAAATADDMMTLGRALGRAMVAGDVVGLAGPLGAGKTTLAQGIAEGLEVAAHRQVTSPTFALVNEHPARVPFVHADFYRLRNAAEVAELGLDEIFDDAAIVIEWVDLFPGAVPEDRLHVKISSTPQGVRTLTLEGRGPRGARLVASLAHARNA